MNTKNIDIKKYNWKSKEKIIQRNKKNAEKRRLTSEELKKKLREIKYKFKFLKIKNLKESLLNYNNQQDKITVKCLYLNEYREITWKYLFRKEFKDCNIKINYLYIKNEIARDWILIESKLNFIGKYKKYKNKIKPLVECKRCHSRYEKDLNSLLYNKLFKSFS